MCLSSQRDGALVSNDDIPQYSLRAFRGDCRNSLLYCLCRTFSCDGLFVLNISSLRDTYTRQSYVCLNVVTEVRQVGLSVGMWDFEEGRGNRELEEIAQRGAS
jgi:hypothetical protein